MRTATPSSVVGSSATLKGSVIPGGLGTGAWFEWGTNALYGNTTAVTNTGNGSVAVPVTVTVTGLTPGVLYHYRIAATNASGSAGGMERLFEIPTLILNGSNPFTNECHGPYADPGVSAPLLAIAAGTTHDLSLKSDGTVYGWGNNQNGESSSPAAATDIVAVAGGDKFSVGVRADGSVVQWGVGVPAAVTNAVAIAAGANNALALTADGSVVGWGSAPYDVPADASNVVAVATGNNYNLVLRADGTVFGWGFGQLPPPPGLSNVAAIAVGGAHSLALRRDSTIVGWGYNYYGQATAPPGLSNVVAIAAGGNHSLALQRDGTVVGWGDNSAGQAHCPYVLFNVIGIAAGGNHSLALESQGAVIGWGDDSFLEAAGSTEATLTNHLGVSGAFDPNVPGTYTLSYQATNVFGGVSGIVSRTVVVADSTSPVISMHGTNPVVLPLHGLFLDPGASVFDVCNGDLTSAMVTNGVVNSNVPGVYPLTYSVSDSAGNFAEATRQVWVGLALPRTLPASDLAGSNATFNAVVGLNGVGATLFYEYGSSIFYGSATVGSNLTGATGSVATSLSLGNLTPGMLYHYRAVATNSGGRVNGNDVVFELPLLKLTGANPLTNECHVAYSEPGVRAVPFAIASGGGNNLAVLGDGTAVGWGANAGGAATVPASLSNLVAVAAGDLHGLALRNDGTLALWGDNSFGQQNAPGGLTNVAAIAAGAYHSVALRNDGTAIAWGRNCDGQTTVPPGESNIVAVAAGLSHSMALRRDGTLMAWGSNIYGQTDVPRALTNAVAIAAGGYMSMALKADGTVAVWGLNSNGQTNPPAAATNIVAIAAGTFHCVALRGNGTVIAWGSNLYGESAPPALGNLVGIAAGDYFSVALSKDGTVYGWGDNVSGQTSFPGSLSTLPANRELSGAVDTNTPGAYSLSYTVTNGFGAIATTTRTVIVADRTPPRFTLFGANPLLLAVNSTFTEPGIAATDTCSGVLTSMIITNGTVNTSVRTNYVVSYSVTDPSGNTSTTNRTVRVGAPLLATLDPSGVSPTNATLNASVNPNGGLTAAWFQWGATTNYGNSSSTNTIAVGTSPVPVSIIISNLLAGTTYHFRIVATNDVGGLIVGVDKNFFAPPLLLGRFGPPTNQFVLRLTANTSTVYSVWASSNLSLPFTNWTFLGRPTALSNNSLQFIDTHASNFASRFYRLRSP